MYRAAPSSHAHETPASIEVCRHCGVVALPGGASCAACGAALADGRVRVPYVQMGAIERGEHHGPRDDDAIFVAVMCQFVCNSCRFAAPLDGLEGVSSGEGPRPLSGASGAVECGCCGLRQRFDVDAWRAALAFAHAVGDLAGPSPEGRRPHPVLWIGSENPHASVGESKVFARMDGISTNELAINVAPGHPVCHACKVALSAEVVQAGVVATICPRCGERATYAMPKQGAELSSALVGALASEHRTDKPRARATLTHTGVEALSCPGCGAPLSLSSPRRLTTCTFCHAACIIPSNVAQRGQREPSPELWWLLFRGTSAARAELLAPTADSDESAASAALDAIKPQRPDATPIGDAPGVYPAPEVTGLYWPQLLLTLGLGTAATLIGLALFEAFR